MSQSPTQVWKLGPKPQTVGFFGSCTGSKAFGFVWRGAQGIQASSDLLNTYLWQQGMEEWGTIITTTTTTILPFPTNQRQVPWESKHSFRTSGKPGDTEILQVLQGFQALGVQVLGVQGLGFRGLGLRVLRIRFQGISFYCRCPYYPKESDLS